VAELAHSRGDPAAGCGAAGLQPAHSRQCPFLTARILLDLAPIVKEAAWFGLACGVIMMAAALLYLIGTELMKPTATVAAATPKPPFGFCAP
jgi:hypothetical protein